MGSFNGSGFSAGVFGASGVGEPGCTAASAAVEAETAASCDVGAVAFSWEVGATAVSCGVGTVTFSWEVEAVTFSCEMGAVAASVCALVGFSDCPSQHLFEKSATLFLDRCRSTHRRGGL